MLYDSLIVGGVALAGVILGYELGRAARFGKPLIRLPKWRKKKDTASKGRQYTL